MIFACCHPHLARENQIALTLKTLCGFGTVEIARALLVSDETIKKRIQRATRDLVERQIVLEPPEASQLIERFGAVHQVLYLIFNEGYSSTQGDKAIRDDLCEEAVRLCQMLCAHRQCSTPTTRALMALMLFHAARLESRVDEQGSALLLEEQDRTKWDYRLIKRALEFLNESAEGTHVSTFHLEAGIAFYHCAAESRKLTDWPMILRLYDALVALHPSPVYVLNRAIALAEIEGPSAGILALAPGRQRGASELSPLRRYPRRPLPPRRRFRASSPALRNCARQDRLAPRSSAHRPPNCPVPLTKRPHIPGFHLGLV